MAGLVRQHTGYRKKLLKSQSAPKSVFGDAPSTGNAQLRRGAKEQAELYWMLKEVLLSPLGFVLGFAAFIAGRLIGNTLLGAGGLSPVSPGMQMWLPALEFGIAILLAFGIGFVVRLHRGLRRIAVILGLIAALWYEPSYIGQLQAQFEGMYPFATTRGQLLPF